MKQLLSILLCACLLLSLCACQKAAQDTPSDPAQPDAAQAGTGQVGPPVISQSKDPSDTAPLAASDAPAAPPTVLTPAEYVLYTNIFYNQTGDDYVGQSFTKTGTLARIEDAFNGCIRWYVWGYNDQTKCCDWQWEIVPTDVDALPEIGSLVNVTGTFAKSDEALDGYWIEDAEVSVKTAYTPPEVDNALTVMGDTLERVQIYNMQYYPGQFENRSVLAYGRIAGPGELEDPYYDGSWTQKFNSGDELPPIGTVVILNGTFHDGVIDNCSITPTDDY